MKHIFNVKGMSCGHCEKTVIKALKKVDEQAIVQVSLDEERVEVQSSQTDQRLIEAIENEGYTVVR
ncbi:MAG TPA: heavy-metal-associated domain-containing protein [Pseudomonadales bacterium]|nr:heavy-metal-associated domain-containing protein [Pseudomonadales bacterium]